MRPWQTLRAVLYAQPSSKKSHRDGDITHYCYTYVLMSLLCLPAIPASFQIEILTHLRFTSFTVMLKGAL